MAVAVLNIGKMAAGSEDYYLSLTVDRSLDQAVDRSAGYYLKGGEPPGRWLGRGIELLDLQGQVDAAALKAVLAGVHPADGSRLAAHPARKVPGFDLTFRAPKSVSLLWALGDEDVADEVMAAHRAAVDAAVDHLERVVVRTRRGAGGTERVEADGLVAAAFDHRTSRAGDPLLHTHVLAANLVRTSDDLKWRTVESRRLYLHAKTVGYLYQAQLRHDLTARLGLAWGEVTNGYADLDGIPRELIDAFSQRRRAILAELDARGESSAKAAQVATLTTRQAKTTPQPEQDLREAWAAKARELGFDPEQIHALLGRHVARQRDVRSLVGELVDDEALTAKRSTFTRRDLLQAVAERLPDGAPVVEVEALADQMLAAADERVVTLGARRGRLTALDVIRTADGRIIEGGVADEVRMTTRGLLLTEQHAINVSLTRRTDRLALVDGADVIDQVVDARPTMTAEQVQMLLRLTGDGDGVAVVVGRAGTGKTFTLDAARHAWHTQGIAVRGVALAARTARQLEESSGITSTTIARLLGDIDRGPGSPLPPGSVLVVDEAGMVDTRTLARLLDHAAQQQVKVVLVGDPRQLPEIDAGGLYRTLTERLDAIELTDNRRQTQPWEITALDQLRHGDPSAALDAYTTHGRIVTADTAEALRERLVSDWWHTVHDLDADGDGDAIMVALRQTDVDDLNHRARQRLDAAGQLSGPALTVDDGGGVEFRVGDRVMCLRNDRQIGVLNGTLATVEGVDVERRRLQVTTGDGDVRTLPGRYLDAGHVTRGYAITGHKAQGLTVDHTFVLGSDRLYREWGYVTLSRGRHSNRLYLHPAIADPHGIAHGRQAEPDPHTQTLAGLRRSAAHDPAVAFLHPDQQDVADIAARYRHATRQLDHHQQHAERLHRRRDDLSHRIQELDERIADLNDQRAELPAVRLRAETRARADVLDSRLHNAHTTRQRLHEQLRKVDDDLAAPPDDRDLDALRAQRARWGGQLGAVIRARVTATITDPPAWLTATLGARPDGPDRAAWTAAVKHVVAYRTTWDITHPHRPLGDPPDDPTARTHRQQALKALLDARRTLTPPDPDPGLDLERDIERDRAPVRELSRRIVR